MKAIIIILLGSFALYKMGFASKLLQAATIENIPRPTAPPIQFNKATPKEEHITERERLENQARIIVSRMGENPDTVKYMGESLLRALITDYTNCNK